MFSTLTMQKRSVSVNKNCLKALVSPLYYVKPFRFYETLLQLEF